MPENSGPLGKGLGALLPHAEINQPINEKAPAKSPYFLCPIEDICPNPEQPRKNVNVEKLDELAASIREKGILQPLVVVERNDTDNKYQLIAGERRWRAAQLAELDQVPVIVKEVTKNSDRLELALIENIQRQNLNSIEEAFSYQRLMHEFNLTQDEIAKRVGKERPTIANVLRLLQLPDSIKQDIINENLSAGHARALLSLSAHPELQTTLREEIITKQLSVRQAEARARKLKGEGSQQKEAAKPRRKKANTLPDSYCKALNASLEEILGTKTRILQNGSRGKVEIEYYSADDLERLLALISRN